MTRRDVEKAGADRRAAIRRCRYCDPSGWRLGPDGLTADIAIRCSHAPSPPPAPVRDTPADLFSEPQHPTTDTKETDR
ncbi:hypothetical protein A5784_32805 [Mycobacterium sp. 852013-50091_SCH5140682]|uniref:hypothetical protein n=1 Tax=Mycobacterium sp. 852013-50091_SCH5140682 TaxID=1834109 RepID=UPI0007EA0602|nr:hypothetical protein [Mycobacterium sp. 852013-50091_SCH5140682]OBC12611.1 hypothetical protein A5784_32805 [Mycobacterium sp. 852013-50091_SCH5140682]